LKRDADVYVALTDGTSAEGRFLTADISCTVVRLSEGDVTIPRDLAMQVAIPHSGRRWYSIPPALVAGYQITNRTDCSTDPDACQKGRGIILVAIGIGAAGLVYRAALGPSMKVIYTKPPNN
jgi:hypothetical protein